MRVVSLLPSATEILFGLGAGDDVVGVTFECDHPPEARTRPIVSTSAMPEGLSPAEIDTFVAEALARGEDLYHLDADALTGLGSDLVVTQDLCEVCALDTDDVTEALDFLGCRADVLTVDPATISEILDSVLLLGEQVEREEEAEQWVADLRGRLDAVVADVADRERPRVLVLEWTDPPFAPGHWIPEMVTLAGGDPVLGTAGEKSFRTTWEQAVATEPDLVICAPCGYDLEAATDLAGQVLEHFPDVPVWAVDANASFARPGPRVVDGVEALAAICHPEVRGTPAPTAARDVRA